MRKWTVSGMGNYMPTTEEVRAEFVTNKSIRMPTTWRGADEFDRWLNGVKAEAWGEGFCVGERSGQREFPVNPYTENPYRKEQNNE